MFSGKKDSPKVFISYSYDSKEHEDWVIKLTNDLRAKVGVDAMIDKFALNKTSDLDDIMIKGFSESDKVVIVATKKYAERANSLESGVAFETKLATILSRDETTANKLIFIKRDATCEKFDDIFPFQFKDTYAVEFSKDIEYTEKFKELYHKIYNRPYVAIAEIGNSPFDLSNDIVDVTGINVYKIFEDVDFELSNLSGSDLNKESIVIWPVVPRKQVNLIHRAQIEIVRILSLLGWSVKIVIANCGAHTDINSPSKDDVSFKSKLEHLITHKGITTEKVTIKFLHEYFSKDFADGNIILSNFVKISSSLIINRLTEFNTKDKTYNLEVQRKINERSTLKYISPLFTWAVSIYEAEKYMDKYNGCKPIIVAGSDESTQWSHVFSEINSEIGAILIPILRDEDETTLYQEVSGNKLVFTKKALKQKLGKGNFDKWLIQSFVYLSAFPENKFRFTGLCRKENTSECDVSISCYKCMFSGDNEVFSEDIDKDKFIDSIFPQINPASIHS